MRKTAILDTLAVREHVPKGSLVIFCGDANGCPGEEPVPDVTGMYGQGRRTPGGEELLDYARATNLRIMGTWFPKPAVAGTTWQLQTTKAWYTLDHCMVHAKDARVIQDVLALSVPEWTSDHRMILMTVNVANGKLAKSYTRQSLRS